MQPMNTRLVMQFPFLSCFQATTIYGSTREQLATAGHIADTRYGIAAL